MKILIAPDKFKGSLSAKQVAACIGKGIRRALPTCDAMEFPVADGGDGTACVIVEALAGQWKHADTYDPLGRPITATYGIIHGDTAVVDIAAASGLTLLAADEHNPLAATTYGSGILIRHIIESGIRKFIIGLGGSATNDAATGILHALGFHFIDIHGNILIPCGKNLPLLTDIDDSHMLPQLSECEFTVLCDVNAAFYGNNGASAIFAPQKGADSRMVEYLDKGMRNMAHLLQRFTGIDVQAIPFAGAAGGIGGTLHALLGATLCDGAQKVLEITNFEDAIRSVKIVVTGEGKMDKSTLLGKVPLKVCQLAMLHNIPTVAFAGIVKDVRELNKAGFAAIIPVQTAPTSIEIAMSQEVASANIETIAEQIFRILPL